MYLVNTKSAVARKPFFLVCTLCLFPYIILRPPIEKLFLSFFEVVHATVRITETFESHFFCPIRNVVVYIVLLKSFLVCTTIGDIRFSYLLVCKLLSLFRTFAVILTNGRFLATSRHTSKSFSYSI